MAQPQKKNRPKKPSAKELKDKVLLGELADCIQTSIVEANASESEPFETYTLLLRARLVTDAQEFHARFVKGYESILEVLKRKNQN